MSEGIIKTKYGNARLNNCGHYVISSGKEGNHNKMLHRLIFEDFYQIELPEDIVVHHHDGDKTNNEIWNLIPMTKQEHDSLHKTGVKHSDESKEKQSKSMSYTTNTTGYYRVSKRVAKQTQQGFLWRYSYVKDGKRKDILSSRLSDLKEKVVSQGLEWLILDKEKALKTDEEEVKAMSVEHIRTNVRNTTGIYRVSKLKNDKLKNGYLYAYMFTENKKRKRITSTNIENLKEKVLAKGLRWIVLDEDKARGC